LRSAIREILIEEQRGHIIASGQRSASRYSRHFFSLPNCSIREQRFTEFFMAKTSGTFKHPRHMTTEEAVTHLFHPKAIEHLKNEMNKKREPQKKRPQKKG
jgi:hypothetical protein